MQNLYQEFFEPVGFHGVISEEAYQGFYCGYVAALDAMSRIYNSSVYIIDYYKRTFLYVSPNSLFLNGHTVEEIKKMGYIYYKKFVPIEDFNFLRLINRKGFDFFYKSPPKERLKYSISYDFNIRDTASDKLILINHKLTPMALNSKNQIWLALCIVSLANRKEEGEVIIHKSDSSQMYLFDKLKREWLSVEKLKLSKIDIEILKLSKSGYTNLDIANKLCYDHNTIKYHKKHIFAQMKVENIVEAINYAIEHRII